MSSALSARSPRRIALSFGLAAALAVSACGKKEAAKLPTPEVYVTKAVAKDVPVSMELVGQTSGSKDVEIRARVEGYLESVNFRDGDFVKEGTLLYTIDPKPFEAAVANAKAQVATWKARVDQTQTEEARLKPLAEQQAVSRRDYDNAVAARDAALAQLDAAKATLDKAQLDLGYTRITAPVSGLADFTRVKPGNLVGRGESTLLTTISVVDPIYFTASITEADYLKFAQRIAAMGGSAPGSKREAELILADGSVYDHKGRLDAVQRAVDPKTGTLAVRLLFANPDRVVRPGQYGRIRFVSDVLNGAVCVPQKAVSELQGVYQVVVIGPDNKAEIRTVKMGPRSGDLWVVSEGLKAGETVVVEGLQLARPGAEVVARPIEELAAKTAAPAASSSAAPAGK
ncbi:MAG TPA: efflux RND transporter periplasmic adaptor subunit [Thermoanaerobaculia bacterium]|nr:efflux RND transporter periplasmic adaptor subunit [Thermoanaerobaculia bacterium]